jgi:hypothetical protein
MGSNRSCFNCGDGVDEGDYDYVGNSRLWCCGEMECQRELRSAHREAQEAAEERAADDGYSLYGGERW